MRLSLCMIVRDNATIIEECLTSIRPWVDEMVVVDTGSNDATPQLAASLGAKVSQFRWIDDFSAARNASLERAKGDWLFWMDSDDVIDEANGQRLRQLANRDHDPSLFGFVMQVHCPGPDGAAAGDVTIVDHIKMFRNRPDLRFEGRIHEQILSAIRASGGTVGRTDISIVHKHGSITTDDKAAKHKRDLRILLKDLEERPNHPFVLFNLGMTYADMERPIEAAEYLRRSINAAGPDESHLGKAYALLAACLLQSEEIAEASGVCEEACRRFPDDPEIMFRRALVAHQLGQHDIAIERYQRLIDSFSRGGEESQPFSSRDAGITGHKARHNLAVVYSESERWEEAEYQWRQALDEAPHFQPALVGLGRALMAQEKLATADLAAQQWSEEQATRYAGLLLAAGVANARGYAGESVGKLRMATSEFPDQEEAWDELARVHFEAGRVGEAEGALIKLSQLRPRDGATLHNLGSVYVAQQRTDDAIEVLTQSLKFRPDSESTRQLLAEVVESRSR